MSVTITDQLNLEKQMISRGIRNFGVRVGTAEENGRGAETSYARRLMGIYLDSVAEGVREFAYGAVRSKYKPLMRTVTPEQAAFFGLKALFNSFTKEQPIISLASQIGTMIEDEARFSKFQEEHKEYYNEIIADFKRKKTKSYRHMHRVLTFKANEKQQVWNTWTKDERVKVGVCILNIITQSTGLITRKSTRKGRKTHTIIEPTQEALDWIDKHKDLTSLMHPDKCPTIIPPDPWTAFDQGGYYSPEMRRRCGLMRTVSTRHKVLLERADLSRVLEAVNLIQDTPWSVNQDVLAVAKDVWKKGLRIGLPQADKLMIPESPVHGIDKDDFTPEQQEAFNVWKREASLIHTQEKERVSKCFQVVRVMQTANEYSKYDKFWFVHTLDFRGRIYAATTGLSPQGPDFAKGLLRFSEGCALGDRGWYWLKVHGANVFGYDKHNYDERVRWADDRRDDILRVATDPLRFSDFWGQADKPYQFLAFCFEYAAAVNSGDPSSFVSHIPVALDGSCNGIQHFSAMLRDRRGAVATNLQGADKPADIYAEVASVCSGKLLASDDPLSEKWRLLMQACGDGGLPRELAKRPVMTLPYGSTRQSCTQYIHDFILKQDSHPFGKKTFEAAVHLTPMMWESIGEVVVAAREAMDWLQQCAGMMAQAGHHTSWVTPLGLPVEQTTLKIKTRRIETQLAGRFQITVGDVTGECNVQKARQSVSPNFVHSNDGSHAQESVVHSAGKYGIKSFATVHDSFGTHAAHTDDFHKALRESFVKIYTEHNPLEEFKQWGELETGLELPPLPETGDFDIQEVLKAPYAFG